MSKLPEEMKTISCDIHWDEKRSTFYVRARGLASSDAAGYVLRFQQVLETDPDNAGVRFLLATYLQMSGQHQEARAELQQVAQAKNDVWSPKAAQVLTMIDD